MTRDFIVDGRRDLWKVLKEIGVKRIAEVGVAHGDNLINLCKCDPEIAVAVDCWSDWNDWVTSGYYRVLKLALEDKRILPIRMNSAMASDCFDDGYFDFIYIDANHHYEHVAEDLEKWWPKVSETGIIAGHDYNLVEWQNQAMGVKRAVDEFAQKIHADICVISDPLDEPFPKPYDSWIICKGPYRISNAKILDQARNV